MSANPTPIPSSSNNHSQKQKEPFFCCKFGKFLRRRGVTDGPPSKMETSHTLVKHDAFRARFPQESFGSQAEDVETIVPARCAHHRILNHSISTPAMCMSRQSHSAASTRSPSPAGGNLNVPSNPVMLSLRTHSMPAQLDGEKKTRITVFAPTSATPRWKQWMRRKPEKNVSIPPLPANSATLVSRAAGGGDILGAATLQHEAAAVESPQWNATFIPNPPLSTLYPTSYEDLDLTPVTTANTVTPDDDFDEFEKTYVDHHQQTKSRHRQSVNKLARTLGVLPHDFVTPAEMAKLSSNRCGPFGISAAASATVRGRGGGGSKLRRMSLSLKTNLSTPPSLCLHQQQQQQLPMAAQHLTHLTPNRRRSRASLSTSNTEDLHKLGLTADENLSDTWGKVHESEESQRGSIYSSYSPISPITFKPPTPDDPLAGTKKRASSTSSSLSQVFLNERGCISTLSTSSSSFAAGVVADKVKLEQDMTSSPSLAGLASAPPAPPPPSLAPLPPPTSTLDLARSRSLPNTNGSRNDRDQHNHRRASAEQTDPHLQAPEFPLSITGSPSGLSGSSGTQVTSSAAATATAADAADVVVAVSSMPTNRLLEMATTTAAPSSDEEANNAKSFVARHPEYADEFRNWSGQWNQDDMQYVIRTLRALK